MNPRLFVAAFVACAFPILAFAQTALFQQQDLSLEGRLRYLTLEDVISAPDESKHSDEIVVLGRSGIYPDWHVNLEIWNASGKAPKPERISDVDLPPDTIFYGFAPFIPSNSEKGLFLVRPGRIEIWRAHRDAARWIWKHDSVASPAPMTTFLGPELGSATPFSPLRSEALWTKSSALLVPVAGGYAKLHAVPAGLRLESISKFSPRAFYRSHVELQPFDFPFLSREVSYHPDWLVGSLNGKDMDLLTLWMDEVARLPAGNTTNPETFSFNQFSEKERDDAQAYVVIKADDLNADGRTDFIVNKFSGSATSINADTSVFLTGADGKIPVKGMKLVPQGNRAGGALPVDFNRDGKKDLIVASSNFGIWAIVRALLQKTVSITFSIYLHHAAGYRLDHPDFSRDISFRFDLKDAEIEGILPTLEGDFNGDGYPDAIYARDRKQLSVILQRPKSPEPFSSYPSGSYSIAVPRSMRVGDVNGDGLSDVVLYDRRASGNKTVAVLINQGQLK